ncbi:DUF2652 domain-containing protein [Flagellimonas hymeniacidonis]|uniref:DUF2652 domain-containing protein n=1 Tax=Flagellimonas hymeniacidonis TaxID=2603628 RepID=A0A5C8V4Q0_9FLAO|nr:DUF2652 domain-containing protein [Flagellimonas hymeniacidonis]TXN35728.1 DUF2652 domain-containing protein [Flagellimonas hymeniacidonis]
MPKSLLFIPDISGYTKFIQTTEVEHSQHVISELLEVLLNANTQDLKLAEIEGDALFFYKENDIPSQENLLAQIESMFTAFYSHLKMLEKNRICPCNACATAPNLQLKIVAHSGNLQHIEVQGNRKPFGEQVIEAHRLLKNSIDSDNYALISRTLSLDIMLSPYYSSKIFRFRHGSDAYDDREIEYIYSIIDPSELKLRTFAKPNKVYFENPPQITMRKEFPVAAEVLMEYVTNYSYRHFWTEGIDRLEYNENEITRAGSEHICVVNGKHLNFTTATKDVKPGSLIYGEFTTSPPPLDEMYQFYIFTPISENSCELELELYWKVKSPIKKLFMALFGKKVFKKNIENALSGLFSFIEKKNDA